ncbi:DUF2189 domain-containing protein [Thiomicrorhabdus sp. Kp2]|uniref:DUF2189 domain-containing protein n=1 Tax=Thiomicrorhabdus sp. Kp2 TaxID=1123518 RepID=UPI0004128670|nr:DUF2189 domain-containing protein [Thiomicrorhabdus sp. Kp2]
MAHLISAQNTHDHYTESGEHIVSRDVSISQIGVWLKKGWMDMAHAPVASLFYGLVIAFTVYAVHSVFKAEPLMLFNLSTFFIMLTPFLATGLYAISINISKGEYPNLFNSMFAWRKNVTEFALFALALGIIIAIWGRITPLIAAVVKSNSLLIVNPDLGVMGFLASDAGMSFMAYFLVGAAIVSAFVFAISVVTIPLLLRDTKVGVISAMVLSFQVVMENKLTMAVWALVIASSIVLGLVTLGLAMIIVMPLLGYASWHAFNDLIEVDDNKTVNDIDLS